MKNYILLVLGLVIVGTGIAASISTIIKHESGACKRVAAIRACKFLEQCKFTVDDMMYFLEKRDECPVEVQ